MELGQLGAYRENNCLSTYAQSDIAENGTVSATRACSGPKLSQSDTDNSSCLLKSDMSDRKAQIQQGICKHATTQFVVLTAT